MKKGLSLKISVSGVRGIVGDSLTPQLASNFAQAFGTYLGRGKMIVGRDARPSGAMLQHAVFSGLLSVGCQPVDIGVCPIPSTMVLTKESRARGAIVVTASHNPPDWNGLKFINEKGLFFGLSQVQEFLDIYHQGEFSWVKTDMIKIPSVDPEPTRPHLEKLLDQFDTEAIRKKRFAVAADCCSGAGARLLPEFLENLGCRVLLTDASSSSKKHPLRESGGQNISLLCREVKRLRADVGFAQDADADRLSIISEQGTPLGDELTLALAVDFVLSRKSGPVVINLSTSRAVEDIARRHNAPLIRTKIGEINVVEQVLRRKAVIGGEGNGGVIFPPVHPCRDSFSAMGLILESMACSGKRISELVGAIPAFFMIKDNIAGTMGQAHQIVRLLKRRYEGLGNITTDDGLKIDFKDSWIHVRGSNTEPIIRIIAESKNRRKTRSLVDKFKKEIRGIFDGSHH